MQSLQHTVGRCALDNVRGHVCVSQLTGGAREQNIAVQYIFLGTTVVPLTTMLSFVPYLLILLKQNNIPLRTIF